MIIKYYEVIETEDEEREKYLGSDEAMAIEKAEFDWYTLPESIRAKLVFYGVEAFELDDDGEKVDETVIRSWDTDTDMI